MSDPHTILRKMQMTEKGSALVAQNKYLFEVRPSANKIQIKAAIEKLFKVKVTAVNTMNCRGKRKRERTVKYGKRSDWKRAVVTLCEGDKIDLT